MTDKFWMTSYGVEYFGLMLHVSQVTHIKSARIAFCVIMSYDMMKSDISWFVSLFVFSEASVVIFSLNFELALLCLAESFIIIIIGKERKGKISSAQIMFYWNIERMHLLKVEEKEEE